MSRPPLAEYFLVARPGPAPADLEAQLAAVAAAGRAAHPGLDLDEGRFVEHVAARASADELGALRAGELYLAAAVLAGVPGAAERFVTTTAPIVRAALRRLLEIAADVDEVTQTVRQKLVVGGPGRPRLADYTGHRPLGAWLHVVAARAALDHRRHAAASRVQVAPEDVDLEVLVDGASAPELEIARRLDAGLVKRAFAGAVAALDVADRTLLRQHVLDGLTIDDLGAMLAIHRVTAARRLERARRALTDELRRQLVDRLGLSAASVDSLLRFVESRVDLSIERVLGEAVP